MIPTYPSLDSMWSAAVSEVLTHGSSIHCRNGGSTEVLGWSGTLVNPLKCLATKRGINIRYAGAEFLWYLSGQRDARMIQHYAPQYEKFCENGIAWGAYGWRWANDTAMVIEANSRIYRHQFHFLTDHLKKCPYSRQAIVTMWNAGDLVHAEEGDKKDLPCTLSLQFFIRDNYLHLITTMRSNDLWYGMPYDVFCFCMLQMMLADFLGVQLGTYTHQVGSLHVYLKDRKKITDRLNRDQIKGAVMAYDHCNCNDTSVSQCLEVEADIRTRDDYSHSLDRCEMGSVQGQALCMAVGPTSSMFHEHAKFGLKTLAKELLQC
jgi:thymidylate synthase